MILYRERICESLFLTVVMQFQFFTIFFLIYFFAIIIFKSLLWIRGYFEMSMTLTALPSNVQEKKQFSPRKDPDAVLSVAMGAKVVPSRNVFER